MLITQSTSCIHGTVNFVSNADDKDYDSKRVGDDAIISLLILS